MKVSFVKPPPQSPPRPLQPPPRSGDLLVPSRTAAPGATLRKQKMSLGWYLLLLLAALPLLYFGGKIAQASLVVEAPGFLRRDHVAAYVPRNHPEYAAVGRKALVLFPDGEQLPAAVTGSPPLPQTTSEVGLPVRMDFIGADGKAQASRRSDGLPVRVRFQRHWSELLPRGWGRQLHDSLNDARERLRQLQASRR